MKSSLFPLIAMAALMDTSIAPQREYRLTNKNGPQKPARSGDRKHPIHGSIDPTRYDEERINEAKDRRIQKAAKRAEQIAKSRANNYK